MSDQREVAIVRWPGQAPSVQAGLAELLAAYHLQTQAEKGENVAGVDGLPNRYRVEVADPQAVFVDDVVRLALSGDTAVGCLVVTA
jgi:putative acetyltransferase